jgi:hypothetical protein
VKKGAATLGPRWEREPQSRAIAFRKRTAATR